MLAHAWLKKQLVEDAANVSPINPYDDKKGGKNEETDGDDDESTE